MEEIFIVGGFIIFLVLIKFWWVMIFDAWDYESTEDRWRYIGIIFFLGFVGAGWYWFYRQKPRYDMEKEERKRLMKQEKPDNRLKMNKNKIFDVIVIVGGAFIVVVTLLSEGVEVAKGLAIGMAMIAFGFFRRRWKKYRDKRDE